MPTASTNAHEGPAAGRSRPAGLSWTSLVFSAALLVAIVLLVDARQVFAELKAVDTRWLGAAFVVHMLELAVLGARYANIARALGVSLTWLKATTEYALSTLVNQLLPTGVLGDGLRAVRQAKHNQAEGLVPAVEAVALDRLSGYLVLWLVVLATAPFGLGAQVFDLHRLGNALAGVALAVCAGALILVKTRRLERLRRGMASTFRRGARVLLVPRQAMVHVPLSLLLTGLILAQLYIAARAIGVELHFGQLLWLGPLLLLATSMPSFFAGWGIREGASALLFASVGLPSSTGVAVALVFGAFTLIASSPGAVVLLFDPGRAVSSYTRWGQAHALSMTAGLGLALWAGFPPTLALVACLSLVALVVQSRAGWTPSGAFGFANSVTGFRLALTTLILLGHDSWAGAWLASVAVLVLLLDVVDGWWARRHRTTSEFGAQFDIEVDTVLVVSLCLVLFARGQAGAWIFLPPLLRYAYVLLPILVAPQRSAPARTRVGRFAYVFMMTSFITALLVPASWGVPMTLAGTTAVTLSFLTSFWQSYAPEWSSGTPRLKG